MINGDTFLTVTLGLGADALWQTHQRAIRTLPDKGDRAEIMQSAFEGLLNTSPDTPQPGNSLAAGGAIAAYRAAGVAARSPRFSFYA